MGLGMGDERCGDMGRWGLRGGRGGIEWGLVGGLSSWFGMPVRGRKSVIRTSGNRRWTRREQDDESVGEMGVRVDVGTSVHTLPLFYSC